MNKSLTDQPTAYHEVLTPGDTSEFAAANYESLLSSLECQRAMRDGRDNTAITYASMLIVAEAADSHRRALVSCGPSTSMRDLVQILLLRSVNCIGQMVLQRTCRVADRIDGMGWDVCRCVDQMLRIILRFRLQVAPEYPS